MHLCFFRYSRNQYMYIVCAVSLQCIYLLLLTVFRHIRTWMSSCGVRDTERLFVLYYYKRSYIIVQKVTYFWSDEVLYHTASSVHCVVRGRCSCISIISYHTLLPHPISSSLVQVSSFYVCWQFMCNLHLVPNSTCSYHSDN